MLKHKWHLMLVLMLALMFAAAPQVSAKTAIGIGVSSFVNLVYDGTDLYRISRDGKTLTPFKLVGTQNFILTDVAWTYTGATGSPSLTLTLNGRGIVPVLTVSGGIPDNNGAGGAMVNLSTGVVFYTPNGTITVTTNNATTNTLFLYGYLGS